MLSELGMEVSHMVHKKPAGREGSLGEQSSILGKACLEQRWEEKELTPEKLEDFREQPRKAEHLACSLHPGTHAAGHGGHSTKGDAAQGSRMENSLSATTLGGCGHRVVTVIAAPTEGQVPS